MRLFLLISVFCIFIIPACQVKHRSAKQVDVAEIPSGKTLGIVSHKYRDTGCATVIIVKKDGQEDLTLIPKDTLQKEIDVDGLEIFFNYRLLKMKNPAGCNTGTPALLTDISKK
jgi:hypothetical protein